MPPRPLRIGTRGSSLALAQARGVAAQLRHAGRDAELVVVQTSGDRHAEPIRSTAETGVFTKELQFRLLAGEIDVAVHSLKDLPTEVDHALWLAAVPPRESVHEVLISRGDRPLRSLATAATVGTGSLRRQAQLRRFRPDLQPVDIRGNIETRIKYVQSGRLDAVLLAAAGMRRLGMEGMVTEELDPLQFLPAVGQGALGLEVRAEDGETTRSLRPLCHLPSRIAVWAERALLRTLRGGCLSPVAAWARFLANGRLQMMAEVLSRDGQRFISAQANEGIDSAATGDWQVAEQAAEELGIQVARDLLDRGAQELLICRNDAEETDQAD